MKKLLGLIVLVVVLVACQEENVTPVYGPKGGKKLHDYNVPGQPLFGVDVK